MRFCPYAHRTILALNAKKIDYEVINVDLVDKPEWIFTKSPLGGKVPAIEIKEGETIYESLITVEYLDEVYPQRPLLPKDPLKKAFDKIIVEVLGSSARDTITQDHIAAFHKGLEFIQTALQTRGTTFLDGEEPGYADYMIWPWFERLRTYDDDITSYIQKMEQDPAVSQYLIPKDILTKFQSSYGLGIKPDYELLNKN
ncbi:Glutathione S-transferase 6 [Operophtera brumata]|uniref:Glutathione S-transferase 6 n=1 Tax=Operophtera brumata TaxID=104452 RepID=A0A0L7LIF7_OPEBR|nr:Glutathione S-transferase 6 [Operophtera brumata]